MGAPRLLLGSGDLARRVQELGTEIAEFLADDTVVVGVDDGDGSSTGR